MPPPTSRSMTSHRSLRLWGSRPVVGSSRKSTVGWATRAAARSRRRRMPPEYVFSGPVAGIGQVELVEQLDGPRGHDVAGEVVEVADHLQVLPAGEVLVDGGVLAGQADQRAHQRRLLLHVVAEHPGRPAVGPEDGGEDPDGRGLAGSVGSEQPEDGALLDGEADPVEGAHLALALEGLLQVVDFDGGGHGGGPVWWRRGWRLAVAAGGRRGTPGGPGHDHVQSRYIASPARSIRRRRSPAESYGATGRRPTRTGDADGRPPLASSHGQRRQGTRLRAPRRGRRPPPAQRAGGVRARWSCSSTRRP